MTTPTNRTAMTAEINANLPTNGLAAITAAVLRQTLIDQLAGTVAFNGDVNVITNALFRQSAPLSVVGNAGSSIANVGDIAGVTDQALVVNPSGTALGFGPLNLSGANAVTGALPAANFRASTGLSVVGNGTASSAAVADITGTANQTLVVNSGGTALAFGALNLAASAAVTGALPVAHGGTAGTTATNARSSAGLNIDQMTAVGDAAYQILATDRVVATNASLSAPRIWTLPAANSINQGQQIVVTDLVGGASGTNTITIARNGSDTINGSTSVIINTALGAYLLWSDGVSKWSAQAIGAAATSGVSSIGGLVGTVGLGAGLAASGSNVIEDPTYSRGAIGGLTLSNDGSAPNTVLDIAAGYACSDDASTLMKLGSAFTKSIASNWAVGSGNGGLDTGTVGASLFYHTYLIERTDTGVVDVLLSLSPPTSAPVTISIASPAVITWAGHGLQIGSGLVFSTTGALPTGIAAGTRYYVIAGGFGTGSFEISTTQGGAAVNTSGSQSGTQTATSGPLLPTNYTKQRRIGTPATDASSHILAFSQNGDEFLWSAAVASPSNTSSLGATAILMTMTVPTGFKVNALFTGDFSNASTTQELLLTSPDQTDVAPLAIAGQLTAVNDVAGSAQGLGNISLRTNTSGQIRARATAASCTIAIATYGYIDTRGRFS